MLLRTTGAAARAGGLLPLVGKRTAAAVASSTSGVASSSGSSGGLPANPLPILLRALSTAPPKQQRKGKTLPTRNPQRTSAPTLEGKPPAVILDRLKQKCEGASRPRLSDLHALLEAARADEGSQGTGAVLQEGLALFVTKNVEFREETASLFLRAMCRAGGLGEAVDALLDKGKRIGIWAPRKTLHMALHKLGQEGDKDRLLQLYEAMEPQLGVPRTARSVHLAVRGLVSAGAVEEAQKIAAAAEKTMALADSTKEILSKAKAEAAEAAAAEKKATPKAEEGKKEEGAAAPAAEGEKK